MNFPSYEFALILAFGTASLSLAVDDEIPAPDQAQDITYGSPEAALESLRLKEGVTIREENDWFVVTDPGEHTVWSLTQRTHPAHPTIVKRSIVTDGETLSIDMRVNCGAEKSICDIVIRQFQAGDDAATGSLRE
ncbi:hypothetical protein [uncultured Aquimonas sp.]|uniref:hypothetical protein n=1 Tax=uncultured Aquimonas sp. TaxID=385483 RepID=UPI0026362ACB|nr:hypothetical protein [uncultured Aquimonas sp.]